MSEKIMVEFTIEPTKSRASLIVAKGADHRVTNVHLRRKLLLQEKQRIRLCLELLANLTLRGGVSERWSRGDQHL